MCARGSGPENLTGTSGLTKTRVSVFMVLVYFVILSLYFFKKFFWGRGGCNDVVSCKFEEVCVSSPQLKSDMSVAYLLLGGPDAYQERDPWVGGIITPDRFHVFSIYDFIEIVLIPHANGRKISRKDARNLWLDICRQNSQFMEVKGTLGLAVTSDKMPKTPPTAGTTVAGLYGVLYALGNKVSEANRKVLYDIFARYMTGDRSMIVEVNLNDKKHSKIPRFNYNFQSPTVSQAPVASMVIEDAEAGAPEPEVSADNRV